MEQTMTRKTSRVSKLKVGIAAVALGTLLVVPASASDREEQMSIEVEPGVHELALTTADGGALNNGEALTYEPNEQDVTGILNLESWDYTGPDREWDITMIASDFTDGEAEGESFSASNLVITSFEDINLTDGAADGLSTGGTSLGLNESREIVTANGTYQGGQFDHDINFGLTVPANTAPTTYTSTITVDSTQSPS